MDSLQNAELPEVLNRKPELLNRLGSADKLRILSFGVLLKNPRHFIKNLILMKSIILAFAALQSFIGFAWIFGLLFFLKSCSV